MKSEGLAVNNVPHVRMLADDVAGKLGQFHMLHSFVDYGCLLRYDDQGPRGMNPPIIPYAPFDRSRVYTGTQESGSYNHHSQIAKYRGRYYIGFSNGLVDEEAGGQRILVSSSEQGTQWSKPVRVVGGEEGATLCHNCLALYADDEALYAFGMSEDTTRDATVPGMRRIDPETTEMSIYRSTDGVNWTKAHSYGSRIRWVFEAPRLTQKRRLLCSCSPLKAAPAFLLWPGTNILEEPEIVSVPGGDGSRFWHAEGTWYQTNDGTIIFFWRDEGRSCRVWTTWSEDGGKTWSPLAITDIPDSMSRLYAGRLSDGRYYLSNNAFPTLLNRLHLMLLVGDDGLIFNKVYNLIDDPTRQRLKGLLKADGYQYPCCLVDGDKLFVAYSVNKEDIECGIVDARGI